MTVRIPATLTLIALLGIAATGCQQADADPDEFRSITDADVAASTPPDAGATTDPQSLPVTPPEIAPDPDTPGIEPNVDETPAGPDADNPDNSVPAEANDPGAPDVETPTGIADSDPNSEPAVASTTPDDDTATPELAPVEPLEIKLLIPERVFKTEGPEKSLRVSFDDLDLLKVLNMEPVIPKAAELMPDWLTELDGKRIRLRGFMYPPFQDTEIEAFVLARDNQICCFGRDPKVYDLVRILMKDGVTTDYIENRPFDVVGVFHIGDDASIPGRLYTLDDAVVISR